MTSKTLALAAIVAAVAMPLATTAGSAAATPAAPPASPGLFGAQDATYDGTYRQGLAILAYVALDEEPPASALDWLLDQQCANGGWQAFRADTATPCAPSDISTYSGPDSNSTAIAVQALIAVGEFDAATEGILFLESLQTADGGIANFEGATSDTNSTALTAAAVSAYGIPLDDTDNGSGQNLRDALASAQIGCEGAAADRGGYRFMIGDDPFGNDYASVQGVLGASEQALLITGIGSDETQAAPTCPATGTPTASERNASGAWYLAQKLAAGSGTIESAYSPGNTDWSSTRFAVMSLAASGHGRSAMTQALDALAGSQNTTIPDADGVDRAGVLAELILANESARSALTSVAPLGAKAPRVAQTPKTKVSKPAATAEATQVTPSSTPTVTPAPVVEATEVPTTEAPPTSPATEAPAATTADATTATAPVATITTPPAPAKAAKPSVGRVTKATSTGWKIPVESASRSKAARKVDTRATSTALDSQALLIRLTATLQRAAVTTSPVPTSKPSSTGTPAATNDGNGSGLARTGGAVAYPNALVAAALLLLVGAALTAVTARKARGTH